MDDAAPLPITEHELVALLRMVGGPSATLTAEGLGLTPLMTEQLVQRAGIQTLLMRGLIELDGTTATAVNQGRAIAMIAQHTDEVFVLTVENAELSNIMSLVSVEGARLMVSIRPTGVHEARLLDPQRSALDLLGALVEAYTSDAALTYPTLVRIRRITQQGERGVRFELLDANTWKLARSALFATTGPAAEVWPLVAAELQG